MRGRINFCLVWGRKEVFATAASFRGGISHGFRDEKLLLHVEQFILA